MQHFAGMRKDYKDESLTRLPMTNQRPIQRRKAPRGYNITVMTVAVQSTALGLIVGTATSEHALIFVAQIFVAGLLAT
ncbi:hypothetical protein FHX48_000157 [Microbacterium halimionae]|uniref:Uncharacterized protein n=1 Tax=Microbacterium halimionae TaxID=1526413 RepID=A0A7W3JLK8_9MICO|nr:hypothetical protein [Microbacterium halimionae]MBA8815105.1 hypothetical protein [Microbacterium halimionae]NII94104.1 hypothetical protein [Microbacterium halimionae]